MANSKLCFLLHETSSAAKPLAPQGGTHPPKSVAFSNHLYDDWMGGKDATRRIIPLKNPTYESK
jgi:hypothetical protein